MPSDALSESIVQIGSSETWPEDVRLYQPYEIEQILLPDTANCLSVQAFLNMCFLNFKVEMRVNAESMSPSGQVPFIRCGAFVIAEMDPIVAFVNTRGIHINDNLGSAERADMRAYMSLVNHVLGNAELYMCWCHNETIKEVTYPKFCNVYPFPLSYLLFLKKKWEAVKKLKSRDWYSKNLCKVYEEVNTCCSALSERLGSQLYFFGSTPTELDALVFGHLFAILTTPLPDNQMALTIRGHRNLIDLCTRINAEFFQSKADIE